MAKEKTLDEIMDITLVQAEPVVMDYDTMRERLTATLEQYKGLEVTEMTLKACKEKQKEASAIKKQLDDFRKEVKKRYTEPLQIFEGQIKELESLVDQVVEPIKAGIKEFDDRRRAEKREIAETIIDEMVGEYELTEKYAGQVELRPKYMNLTAKESEVRADVETQCMALKQQQDNEKAIRDTIIKTVEHENESLVAKMNPEPYISLIGRIPSAEIITQIVSRAGETRKNESEAIRAQEEPPHEEIIREPIKSAEIEPQMPNNGIDGTLYKVVFVITGTEAQQKTLSKFLKANHYNYEVESQIVLGN